MTYDVRDNLRRTLERHLMLFLLVVVRLSCILFLSGGFAAFTILFEIPELFFKILLHMPMYNCTCKYLGTCMKFFKNISKNNCDIQILMKKERLIFIT